MKSGKPTAGSIYDDGDYLRKNPTWHVEDSTWKADHVSKLLADNDICPASVLDIGCGAGRVLLALHETWPAAQFVGWDVSTDVANIWDGSGHRIELRHGDFRDDPYHYDVALMLDVFEHVSDYMGLLRDASTHAERFVFHVPLDMNLSSVIRKRYLNARATVGHLHYFSAESALAVLADTGYDVLDSKFTSGAKELQSAKRPVTHLVNLARSTLDSVSIKAAATILGGYSLLVLAKPSTRARQGRRPYSA